MRRFAPILTSASTMEEKHVSVPKLDLRDPFLYKSIRGDDFDFWKYFVYGVTAHSDLPKSLTRRALRKRPTEKGKFGWRLKFNHKNKKGYYETYSVKESKLFESKEKSDFSKHQSTSYADLSTAFAPTVFGFDRSIHAPFTGIRIATKDALLQRIMLYDGGTVSADYRSYDDVKSASDAASKLITKKQLFTSLDKLAESKAPGHNEVMARLKWNDDGSSQICVFSNNLPSCLLGQLRACDLENFIKIRARERGEEEKRRKDYKVPLSFYTRDPATTAGAYYSYYEQKNQDNDLQDALNNSDPKIASVAQLITLIKNDFNPSLFHKNEEMMRNILELIKLASHLTFETNRLFFKNCIEPNLIRICFLFQNTNDWKNLFNCLYVKDAAVLFDTIQKQIPDQAYLINDALYGYLVSIIDRQAEGDDKLLEHLLNTYKPMLNQVVDDHGNTLLHIAIKSSNKRAVEILLERNVDCHQKNSEGDTALKLAWGYPQFYPAFKKHLSLNFFSVCKMINEFRIDEPGDYEKFVFGMAGVAFRSGYYGWDQRPYFIPEEKDVEEEKAAEKKRTVLKIVCGRKYALPPILELIKDEKKHDAAISILTFQEIDYSPELLNFAISKNNLELIEKLYKKFINTIRPTSTSYNPSEFMLSIPKYDSRDMSDNIKKQILQMLVKHTPSRLFDMSDPTLLYELIEQGYYDVALSLSNKISTIDGKPESYGDVLTIALCNDQFKLANALLEFEPIISKVNAKKIKNHISSLIKDKKFGLVTQVVGCLPCSISSDVLPPRTEKEEVQVAYITALINELNLFIRRRNKEQLSSNSQHHSFFGRFTDNSAKNKIRVATNMINFLNGKCVSFGDYQDHAILRDGRLGLILFKYQNLNILPAQFLSESNKKIKKYNQETREFLMMQK